MILAKLSFGVALPTIYAGEPSDFDAVARFAVKSEELGLHSVWVLDRIFHPDMPTLDAIVSLSYAAAKTSLVKLGTSILIGPQYPAIYIAKAFSSLDILSKGRVILGMALGGGERTMKQYRALGVPIEKRVTRFVEAIRLIRRLWKERTVSEKTRLWELDECTMLPKPAHEIPIWLGGASEGALKRAATLADAWMAGTSTTPQFRSMWQRVCKHAKRLGRSIEAAKLSAMHIDVDRESALNTLSYWLGRYYPQPPDAASTSIHGSPEDCIRQVEELVTAGVRTLVTYPVTPEITQLERYAREVAPSFT